jgi:hypothetical protein
MPTYTGTGTHYIMGESLVGPQTFLRVLLPMQANAR